MENKKGLFIVFEGGEGSGKSTQIELLRDYLEQKKFEVLITKEPGGTPEGKKIREILLSENSRITPKAELFLFEADRDIHLEYLIIPAIQQGKIVISDRFNDSTFAYQSAGRKLPLSLVKSVDNLVVNKCRPDLVLIIKVDAQIGLKRARSTSEVVDRIEKEKIEFHNRVQNYYLKRAAENPGTHHVIDGNKTILEVHEAIKKEIDKLLVNKK